MSLTDLRNNELTIVRKQWHLHHQSSLSGQFLLPAAVLSYCSQQWRIMTAEHNNNNRLFSSLCHFVSHCFPLTDLVWFLSHVFWLLISTPWPPSYNDTLTPQSRIVGNKLFKPKVWPLIITNLLTSIDKCIYDIQTKYKGSCWDHFLSVLMSLNEIFFCLNKKKWLCNNPGSCIIIS